MAGKTIQINQLNLNNAQKQIEQMEKQIEELEGQKQIKEAKKSKKLISKGKIIQCIDQFRFTHDYRSFILKEDAWFM